MSHRHGIQLPQQLRDEIEAKERQAGGPAQHRRKPALSRKEARRNERNGKKERKAQFFSRPKDQPTATTTAQQHKRPPENETAEQRPAKRQKTDKSVAEPVKPGFAPERPRKEKASTTSETLRVDKPVAIKPSKVKPTALERLQAKLDDPAPSRKRKSKDEEDDKIAYLEAKLGLNKKSKKGAGGYASMFADDGLDDLLGDLDRIEYMDLDGSASTGSAEEGSDDEDDENASTSAASEEESDALADDGADVEDVPDDEEWGGIDLAEDEIRNGSESDEADGAGAEDVAEPEAISSEPVPAVAPAGRYIPPALRKQQLAASAPSEEALKLSRQLKGLLNRMSEQNIASVLSEFEDAYRKNSRHDVTSTLTTLIIDRIASHGAHLDAFVIIHAALVGALHRLIGVEFAAHFVQTAVERYDAAYAAAKSPEAASTEESNKQCANLLALISELYALQTVACVLLYDIVRSLLDGPLDERDVELLLKLVRASGPQMRSDDPSALKDIVQLVQDKVASEGEEVNSRTKFMIETLGSLKSGKAKRGADADGVGSREVVERMKKFLGGLSKKRQVMAHEPLRVGLTDLRDADKRGRWWLVGAAWAGDPLLEHRNTTKADDKPVATNTEHDALLALARKHGMTTDVRRNIFVVLMSSEDCVDAANRLAALNLSDVQQREIVRVALHCLGAERSGYNPFWALVLQRTSSPSQKITLQFALWDFLRGMGESKVGGSEVVKNADDGGYEAGGETGEEKMENVARAYGWWIAKGACAITVLKPLEFQLLLPQTRKFLRRLFTHLIISTQTASPVTPASKITNRKREALERVILLAARVPILQQGLLYFLPSVFKKTASGAEGELIKWGVEVAKETLAAGVDLDALDEDD